MTYIDAITDRPNQTMNLKLATGDFVYLTLRYSESQRGWYYSFTYGSFSVNNRRIVAGVNMIRALRGLLPFGFSCITTDGYEPVFKEDFANKRAKFFLLNVADMVQIETMLQAEQVRNG